MNLNKRIFGMLMMVVALLLVSQSGSASVLIVGGDSAADINDVQNKIASTGLVTGPIDTFDFFNGTPTLANVQAYDAVFFWHDFGGDLSAFGDVLADYVDSGGGVVLGVFSNASGGLGGRWASGGYDPLNPAGQINGPQLFLGTVHNPAHPVMDGVSTFDGGSGSWRSTGGVNPGATLIAEWSNGDPLITEMPGFNGRIISLNFLPPSSDSGTNSSFWNPATDGDLLMANAVTYVSSQIPVVPQSIPTLSEWGMIVMSLILTGSAFWMIRRRQIA